MTTQNSSNKATNGIVRHEDRPLRTAWEGVQRRVLAYNPELMLVEHQFAANADLPAHSHPHTQITYIVSGRLWFAIEGREPFEAGPGDSVAIDGGVTHRARALEPTVVLDCFTPAREDYRIEKDEG